MAFNLPLSKVVPDVEAGGGLVTAMKGQNALREMQLKNQYYGPNIESEINNRNALTQGQNIHNKYLPDEYRLANQTNQQKLDWNPKNWQSENAFRNSQTTKNNTMLPYDVQNQKNINDWYARKAQSSIDANKALADYRATGGGAVGTGGKDLNDMAKAIKAEHPDWTPEKILDARSRYFDGESTFSNGEELPTPTGSIKQLLKSNFKRTTDAGQRAQERFADTLETAIKSADKNINSAVKYSGLIGKGQGSSDKLNSLLGGESSKDFKAFNNFVRVDVPTIAGEYMRQLGVNASDEQKRMYKEVVNPVNWINDPKTALSQWKYFKQLAKNIAGTISKDAYQRNNELKKSTSNNESNSNSVQKWGRDASGNPVRIS